MINSRTRQSWHSWKGIDPTELGEAKPMTMPSHEGSVRHTGQEMGGIEGAPDDTKTAPKSTVIGSIATSAIRPQFGDGGATTGQQRI